MYEAQLNIRDQSEFSQPRFYFNQNRNYELWCSMFSKKTGVTFSVLFTPSVKLKSSLWNIFTWKKAWLTLVEPNINLTRSDKVPLWNSAKLRLFHSSVYHFFQNWLLEFTSRITFVLASSSPARRRSTRTRRRRTGPTTRTCGVDWTRPTVKSSSSGSHFGENISTG